MSDPTLSSVATASRTAPPLYIVWQSILRNTQFTSDIGLARVACGALFIGLFLGAAIQWVIFVPAIRQFGIYVVALFTFHLLEFIMTAIFHPRDLTFNSFLLNHSVAYHAASAAGMLEFWLEYFFVPSFKDRTFFIVLGLLMVIGGQLVRSLAMYTASSNFTHIIAERKKDQHALVTFGVYSICRHPSYAGWFWWSIGTQVLLGNPICMIAYAYATWTFFDQRIRYEESHMFRFFGIDYAAYHRRVPSGIPFVVTPALAGDFPASADASTPPSPTSSASSSNVSRPMQPSYLDGVVHQSGPAAMLRRTPSVQSRHNDNDHNDHNDDGDTNDNHDE